MNVGVRELRDGLSKHLAAVRAGEEITVTDHGTPVARLIPYDAPSGLERLIAAGLVTPGGRRKGDLPAPIDIGTTASDLIADQRR